MNGINGTCWLKKKKRNRFRIFSIASKCSQACGVSAVKPDDKNVYSRAVIKERVSQSKLSITQYPWRTITRATTYTLQYAISVLLSEWIDLNTLKKWNHKNVEMTILVFNRGLCVKLLLDQQRLPANQLRPEKFRDLFSLTWTVNCNKYTSVFVQITQMIKALFTQQNHTLMPAVHFVWPILLNISAVIHLHCSDCI